MSMNSSRCNIFPCFNIFLKCLCWHLPVCAITCDLSANTFRPERVPRPAHSRLWDFQRWPRRDSRQHHRRIFRCISVCGCRARISEVSAMVPCCSQPAVVCGDGGKQAAIIYMWYIRIVQFQNYRKCVTLFFAHICAPGVFLLCLLSPSLCQVDRQRLIQNYSG